MTKPSFILLILYLSGITSFSQEQKIDRQLRLRFLGGFMNYQGDLNPTSFSLSHSRFAAGIAIVKPLNRWFSLRAGFTTGKVEAADRYNRDYLKPRNLSFFSTLTEVQAALEINILDIERSRISPYLFAGIAFFHFNPWTYDDGGQKVFLKPLSTEGQGLSEYPSQKPYELTQLSLPYGIGLRYRLTDAIVIGVEFSQRKTFTDYLDDVSSYYVDRDILMNRKGAQAIQLGYRGNSAYPASGEQRGTPTENDWYYTGGFTVECKLNTLLGLLGISTGSSWKCPSNVY